MEQTKNDLKKHICLISLDLMTVVPFVPLSFEGGVDIYYLTLVDASKSSDHHHLLDGVGRIKPLWNWHQKPRNQWKSFFGGYFAHFHRRSVKKPRECTTELNRWTLHDLSGRQELAKSSSGFSCLQFTWNHRIFDWLQRMLTGWLLGERLDIKHKERLLVLFPVEFWECDASNIF